MHCLKFASVYWSSSHWSWWQNSHGIQQSGVESTQKLFFPEQLCNNQWICKLLTLTHWNNLGLSFHFALIGLTLHLSLPKWVAMPKICAGMFALSEGTWRLNWKARILARIFSFYAASKGNPVLGSPLCPDCSVPLHPKSCWDLMIKHILFPGALPTPTS